MRAPAARAAWIAAALALALVGVWIGHGDQLRSEAASVARDQGATSDVALQAARRARRWNPIDPESRMLISRLLLERSVASRRVDELPEAEQEALRAIERDPRTPGHWSYLGKVRLARSDPQGAYIALDTASRLYPIRIEYREDRDRVAALLSSDGRVGR